MANDSSHNHPSDQDAVSTKFSPGQKVFDRYTLKRILGSGGMGVVWLARDGKLDQDVALKFLSDRMLGNPNAIERLKRETRHSLQLTHPNIVRIYDFVEDKSAAAIAMEYVDGWSLWAMKVDKPDQCFTAEEITPWIGQLCEALEYAHTQQRIVHRDLKPSNLMINARGQLKVSDFGLARNIRYPGGGQTSSQVASGTIGYMSPQQAMGEETSVLDDIYSVGATIYELLTGTAPFYKGEILAQLQELTPPSMTERLFERGVERSVPWVWEETIARCLEKDPLRRPQSAAEIWRLLQRSEKQVPRPEPVEIEPEPEVEEPLQAEPKVRPRWMLPAVAAIAFVSLCAVVVWKVPFKKLAMANGTNEAADNSSKRESSEGALDLTFDPHSGTDEEIRCVAVQADGKILIGGPFISVNNVPHRGIARLNADGSLDENFATVANGTVHAIHILPNKQILLGGDFQFISGTRAKSVARLNADGSVDSRFQTGEGADHEVRCIIGLDYGQMLVGGHFTKFNRRSHSRIARLNADGSVDETFTLNCNNLVWTMATGSDGRIFLGGNFTSKGMNRITCIDSSGAIDSIFRAGTSDVVYAIAVQRDGKVIIGGKFNKADGTARNALARLNYDGTLDMPFAPVIDDGTVQAIALQSDGKIIIGGMFTSIAGVPRKYIARLNTDGSLDRGFDPGKGPNFVVRAIGIQPNDDPVIVGGFGFVDGVPRARVARLHGK